LLLLGLLRGIWLLHLRILLLISCRWHSILWLHLRTLLLH
jgi:hypothetical protein